MPNILFIDGLTEDLGEEGLDPARLDAVCDLILSVVSEHEDQLQIILADNEIPEQLRPYVRLELREGDWLIGMDEEEQADGDLG